MGEVYVHDLNKRLLLLSSRCGEERGLGCEVVESVQNKIRDETAVTWKMISTILDDCMNNARQDSTKSTSEQCDIIEQVRFLRSDLKVYFDQNKIQRRRLVTEADYRDIFYKRSRARRS